MDDDAEKPLEQEWAAVQYQEGGDHITELHYGDGQVRCLRMDTSDSERDADYAADILACAKLMAAAPEMARLLLEIQHIPAGYDEKPSCPTCGMTATCDRKQWPHAHTETCPLLAVLTKAGVVPS